MRVARPVILNAEQRQALEQRARARSLPAGGMLNYYYRQAA